MAGRGWKHNIPAATALTESEVEAIHQATLNVLRTTGVTVNHEAALKLMADAGCLVDHETRRVRVPEDVIDEALKTCPKTFTCRARDENDHLALSGTGDVTYFASAGGMNSVDLDTWEPKVASRKEFYDLIKVLDYLPYLDMHSAFPYYGFAKVPQAMKLVEATAGKIRNSTKVVMEGWVEDNFNWNIELCKATGQDHLNLVNPASPLTYPKNMVDAIYASAGADHVFHVASGPVAGATGPSTIAGVVIVENANCFPAIILSQLIRPGARVWAGNFMTMQNMVNGSPAFSTIEDDLITVAHNQMWMRYGLPTWCVTGGFINAKTIDYQAGYETGMGAVLSAASGSSVIFLHGGLNCQLESHPVKAILDDDIAGMVGRYLRGVEVSDETMAVDLINSVGPIPGHFLDTAHTRKWWKKEQFLPKFNERRSLAEWTKAGKKTAFDLAREKCEAIVADYEPPRLTDQQEQALEGVLDEARKYYRGKGLISDEEWKEYQEDLASPGYPYA